MTADPTLDRRESAQAVLVFWFESLTPRDWFTRSNTLDADIARRFGAIHRRAAERGLPGWRADASGRLAEIIVLDQFSRNLYRDDARAFANDPRARELAAALIDEGLDHTLDPVRRAFAYMPFMHSESLIDQRRSLTLFTDLGDATQLKHAHRHHDVIARFGRFPHRNTALGRTDRPAERRFLNAPSAK